MWNRNKVVNCIYKGVETSLWLLRYLRSPFRGYYPDRFPDSSDEKILIIGNGPSAANVDYGWYKSQGYKLMCVNYFPIKSKLFSVLKPEYLCAVDWALSKGISRSGFNEQTEQLYELLETVEWDIVFVTTVESSISFTNPHIHFFRLNVNLYRDDMNKKWFRRMKGNRATVGNSNVCHACLFYCISSMFHEVLLCGFDQDLHRELYVDENNVTWRNDNHVYGVQHRNLAAEGLVAPGKIYSYFEICYVSFYLFFLLSQYADYLNVKVINLSPSSFIDVFSKSTPKLLEKIDEDK